MNNIFTAASRVFTSRLSSGSRNYILRFPKPVNSPPAYARTLWHMCSSNSGVNDTTKFLKPKSTSECCRCGCSGLLHTKGEQDLVKFLKDEIAEEKKAQKAKSLPKTLDGFEIELDEADITLTKKNQLETIKISLNVNHSVDTAEDQLQEDGSYSGEMESRPSFEIDIIRNNVTLSFNCSYVDISEPGDDPVDNFQIDEVAMFEGEWQEKIYAVSGDILDENLYDLFMIILAEKGIDKRFVEKVSEIATLHEHSSYIGLLEKLSKFVSVN